MPLVPTDAPMAITPPASMSGHAPVMLAEVLKALAPQPDQVVLDATFGGGGYTRALLDTGLRQVLALDRDPDAVARGQAIVDRDPRLRLIHARFGELDRVVADQGLESVDAVVFDLGVSSFQLDQAERGFSFRYDAPLDMRMDREGQTAAELIAEIAEIDLARLLWNYGDEREARRIARSVVAERQKAPIETTRQLADIVARAKGPSRELIEPATRTFQALRIAVNDELAELRAGLDAAERVLRPGGRLVTVAFHSGEDSIVKDFVNERGGRTRRANRHLPALPDEEPRWGWLIDRPLRPEAAETEQNPRARSARLRCAVRLGPGVTYRGPVRGLTDMMEGER
ncbi:MAG TPA: 16S rRNA (cytosine(1402)-N(4))-methyltransferase RsmH [Geminicoccus sp.]|uniref:16S rRNA (cytosine(1402)-N(4))-methyltransferase RsmH n=1 Tax=Geminicoccus sp. TaxID=2024832 RepID=UPI002E30A4B2|nr:16S rRNA (cytosine(1402)-N(4))-methyltransferase RsmH [Geminicoccus sp.]HEX2527021.1 16S rRNA (cytosine(1402)-N(4))-methyltransferase RsmH [Geminicoccus sp.]